MEPPLEGNRGKALVALNVSGLLYGGGYSGDNMFGLKCDYPKMVRALLSRLLEIEGAEEDTVLSVHGELCRAVGDLILRDQIELAVLDEEAHDTIPGLAVAID